MIPDLSILGAFVLASIAIELTPGPNMVYLALLSAQRGRLPGLAAVAGVALGLSIIGLLAAFGVATFIEGNPVLFQLLRWGGVLFLLYLAWDAWQSGQQPVEEISPEHEAWTSFQRGLIANLLNPKAAVFYVSVLPGFVEEGAPVSQNYFMTVVYVVVATLIHGAIVAAAGSVTPWFQNDRWRRNAGLVFGIMLVGVAIWLAYKTQ